MRRKRGHSYKSRIILQTLNKTVNEFDPSPSDWVDFAKTHGSIRPARKGEIVDGQQVADAVTHLIHLRWVPGVRASMRVVVENEQLTESERRVFYIDSVVNLQDRNRRLALFCEERFEPVLLPDNGNWIWQDLGDHIWQDGTIAIWSA